MMALIPTTKRIAKEDLPGAPGWATPLLNGINSFFDAIYNAIMGNLTFGENISAQIKELTFTTSSTYESDDDFPEVSFERSLRRRAEGCFIMQIQRSDGEVIAFATTPDWQEINGVIEIRHIAGLEDSTKYTARFLVI